MAAVGLVLAMALQGLADPAARPIDLRDPSPREMTVMAQRPSGEPPSGSRPAPPAVPPVVHDGVRYEQERSEAGGGALGGVLTAMDHASGRVLWRVTVYRVTAAPDAPGPMALYFRSMALEAGGAALVIEDEAGRRFRVDLSSRAVTTTFDPGAGRRPSPPAGGKPTND